MVERDIQALTALDVEAFAFPMPKEYFITRFMSPNCAILVATYGMAIVGYISSKHKPAEDTARIESIAVTTSMRGQKIGQKLMDDCLRVLAQRAKAVSLHVRKSNAVAIALYSKYPPHYNINNI